MTENLKWSSAWSFVDKYYPPEKNGKRYRDNWEKTFGRKPLEEEDKAKDGEVNECSAKAQD